MKSLYFLVTFLVVCCSGFAKVELDPSQIQLLINNLQKTHHLPAIQVGIKDTETGDSWNFSSGYCNKEIQAPLQNSHLMQIGSTTKSFIGSLVLLLEADSENGSLGVTFNINQTIGDWLPQYPEWKHIQIKNLLNMTSGIPNYTDEESLFIELYKNPKRIWQDSELVALAYSKNPNILFPMGTKYSYSNTNYILVGMILEKVSGLPLETLMSERILQKYPECFKHTTYAPKTYPRAEFQNMAHGYAMHPDKHTEFYGQDITEINLSWAGAAGALVSTASDLASWPELLFSNEFLSKKQREELENLISMGADSESASPLPKDSKLMGYGLGVARLHDPNYGYTWTHTGCTLGYHALFMYLPQKSVVVTVIVNQAGPKIEGEDEDDVVFIAQKIFDNIKITSTN